ncbi:MAG: hypothetical protein IKR19_08650 [Acholeplasmatales bacterium]|nr:hypothetical protein [Acholeplasmatales bacterium]
MTAEMLNERVDKLRSVILNILYMSPEEKIVNPSLTILSDLREAINGVLNQNVCINAFYTINHDHPFFGIRISPNMSPSDAVVILSTDDEVKLNKYQIEFDSKLFEIGLSADEIVALTIYEISSMMDSVEIFDEIRRAIDFKLITMDDVWKIRDSVNYAQLVIFALKDTMYKLSSIMFKDEDTDILANPAIQACGLTDDIISAKNNILTATSGLGESMRDKSAVILQWMMTMYKNMETNSVVIVDALKDAKLCTGSKLEINEIEKAIHAVERIDMSPLAENLSLPKFFEKKNISSVNEVSLFKQLKKNGLRTIEDDLYEYTMKVRNCTNADDAYMILRGINSRLAILEDYLESEQLKESEKNHWLRVADEYRNLRIMLSKKKFKEKSWGVFIDYSALDELDKKDE